MGRFRRIDIRMWGDEKYRRLSSPKPNAQTLWVYLLTGPHTTIIPGLFCAGRAAVSESLGWPLSATERCWNEIAALGMVKDDRPSRLVWIPNSLRYNPPESPNVAAGWRAAIDEFPECDLRREAATFIESVIRECGDAFIRAWATGTRSMGRAAGFGSTVPREVAQAVKERDGNTCRHCGKKVNWSDRRGPDGATYDHLQPTAPQTIDNIVVSCRSCNSRQLHRSHELITQVQPRSDSSRTTVGQANQDQDQEQDQEQDQDIPPNPPPSGGPAARFVKPTIDEVAAYCRERGNRVDPRRFMDHYESNGWKVGRNAMKDWKAAVRNWESNDRGPTRTRAENQDDYAARMAADAFGAHP